MITALLVYLACGLAAGILAGLLGVGGGLVIVPMLVFIFPTQGVPAAHVQIMALGTSLASITITSISSFRAHDKRGAVRWDIWRAITPGILIGTFGGGFLAKALPTTFLTGFFIFFVYYVSIQMFLDFKPKAGRHLPGICGMSGAGGVIGVVSSLVGIGGGSLSVPFMTYCNVPMHTAVGTSAAIGFPIA
ncbi:MAG: sulfite exporter TauE/SafE family protein, partial [Betaproteobacteria bacterium]|nr:sulfite exporter TauE/SafE family protein [Betaproteobacteria bacterium]